MPLNEECGLLEWVSNTKAMKSILEKEYARYGKKIYVSGQMLNQPVHQLTSRLPSSIISWRKAARRIAPSRSKLSRRRSCQCRSHVAGTAPNDQVPAYRFPRVVPQCMA